MKNNIKLLFAMIIITSSPLCTISSINNQNFDGSEIVNSSSNVISKKATGQATPISWKSSDVVVDEATDCGFDWEGTVGRHHWAKITDVSKENTTRTRIKELTGFVSPCGLKNFHYSGSSTFTTSTSLSVTNGVSSTISCGLSVLCAIPGISLGCSEDLNYVYTISSTETYTSSSIIANTWSFDVIPEKVKNTLPFQIAIVGDIYEITSKTWDTRDYWWCHNALVTGTEKEITSYVVADSFTTVYFVNNTYLY